MISTDLYDFLAGLWQQGLELWLEDGQLRFKGNQSLLAGDNLNRLRDNKTDIIRFLEQQPQAFSGFTANQGQRGIYLMQQLASGSSVYNQACLLQLATPINIEKLQQSLNQLVERHDLLKSSFQQQGEQLIQRIHPQMAITLELHQLDGELEPFYQQQADKSFNTQQGPLFRALLIQQQSQHYLLICAHHLIADFWAMQRLIADWQSLYLGETLPELKQSFKEFNLQEQTWLSSEQAQAAQTYWHNTLTPLPEPLNLPLDLSKPAKPSYQGQELTQTLASELSAKLRQAAKTQQVTPFVWALSCFQYLLHRYSGAEDICIGSPVANRLNRDSQYLAGHFANPLVLRSQFQQDQRFSDLLNHNKQQLLQAMRHQQYPIQRLIEELQPQQTLPFFQVAMAWSQLDALNLDAQFAQSVVTMEQRGAIYPLVLSAYDGGDHIQLSWRFDSDLYKPETIKRYQAHLINCLESTISNAEQALAQIDFLTEQEHALYQRINQTEREIPRNISVAALFEKIVSQYPEHIAFRDVAANKNYSYQTLNQDANQIANVLKQQGFQQGDVIGLALGRCYANTAWLLACVKSGIIYIPIDPENPDERIEVIRQTAQAKAIICHQVRAIQNALVLADLQTDIEQAAKHWAIAHNGWVDEDATACIFFTSGSTGTPKGVEIPHRAIVRFSLNTNYPENQPGDKFLHISNPAFDAYNVEVWSSLLTGAILLFIDKEQLLSPASFVQIIQQEQPTNALITTALFNLFVQYKGDIFKDFHCVVFGGEAADLATVNRCIESGKPQYLYNAYGPTENGTYSTMFLIEDKQTGTVPIGYPISNSQAYILTRNHQLAPLGVIGELVVGGDGVSTGYLHQAELTQQHFIDDPFRGKGKLYRTGDLAYLRDDGAILYAGRADAQIKLRGYRIETEEIERHILSFGNILQAYVNVSLSHNQLCAWIIAPSQTIDFAALQHYLQAHLPNFMIPSAFVALDQLPLTANGKVDKRQLPEPVIEQNQAYVAPATLLEQQLAAIWQQHFKLERVGVLDNFFELGGHSLAAAKLASQIEQKLGLSVNMRHFFEYANIKSLARAIDQQTNLTLPIIQTSSQASAPIPASLNQQRLWFLQQLNPSSTAYHMPLALRIHQKLAPSQIEQAINTLIQRHDALHSALIDQQGEAILHAQPQSCIQLEIIHLSHLATEHIETSYIDQLSQSPFDLSQAPLLKAQLLQSDTQQILLLCLHHVALDGLSANILLQELSLLLNEQPLPEVTINYADFSLWQHHVKQHPAWQAQIAYWQQELQGVTPLLNLPTDKPRPAVFHGDAEKFVLTIEHDLVQQLEQFARQQQVSLFMLFISAYAILLQRYSQQDDICIGFPIAGRNQAAVQNTVGLFVNNLVIKTDFHQALSVENLLQQVKTKTLAAFANQDVPFDQIIDALNIERSLSYTPYLQASFAFEELNIQERIEQALGNNFSLITPAKQAAKYDLNLSCFKQTDGTIAAEFEFNQHLFLANSIETMAQHFLRILQQLHQVSLVTQQLNFFSPQEQAILLAPSKLTSPATTLTQKLEQARAQYPNNTAVQIGDKHLSLEELHQRAEQIAQSLLTQDIPANSRVGILLTPSIDYLAAVLALVKLNACYIPLDLRYPKERLQHMFSSADFYHVISAECYLPLLPESANPLLINTLIEGEYSPTYTSAPDNEQNPLYVIFTSGSTGLPKGAAVSRANEVNLLDWYVDYFDFNAQDKWLIFSALGFDLTQKNLFAPLICGAEIVFPISEHYDPSELLTLVAQHQISVINCAPSAFYPIVELALEQNNLEQLSSLRWLLFGGEPIQFDSLLPWLSHPSCHVQIGNMYGPTECTDIASTYIVNQTDIQHKKAPIGAAITGVQTYVLNDYLQAVPVGSVGELYIGGNGVGLGYLGQEALNQTSFIDSPFGQGKLYRTGDYVRWSKARWPEPILEFVSRKDEQIKLRGYRIELGEIENALANIAPIQEAIVQLIDTQLIAYLLSQQAIEINVLRQQLRNLLPDYMIPISFVTVSKWPLTANGKIDKKALPQPSFSSTIEYLAPSNETEEKLCQIWQEVLGIEQVGIQDNFFELGGHSLLATKLAARIRSELQCELALQLIFEYPTIAELAVVLLQQGLQDLAISDDELLALLAELDSE